MSAQRTRDTQPELALRRGLHRLGLRYRVNLAPLPGLRRKADIVFTRARVAVFVDGCFWHGCPEHGQRRHEVNEWYWPEKIERNRKRDADTDRRLWDAGWEPVRVWEHEDPVGAAQRIAATVRSGCGGTSGHRISGHAFSNGLPDCTCTDQGGGDERDDAERGQHSSLGIGTEAADEATP